VNMRDFSNLNLMLASRRTRNSMLQQFRRLTTLLEGQELMLIDPVHLKRENRMQFNTRFRISDWLSFYLLATDVLHPKRVTFGIRPLDGCAGNPMESTAESLAKIILFRDSPKCQARADKWDISNAQVQLDLFKFAKFSSYNIFDLGHLERLLNLNATRCQFEVEASSFFVPSTSTNIADRTEELYLQIRTWRPLQNIDEIIGENFEATICYFLTICPSMKKLHITFRPHYPGAFQTFARWLINLNKKLTSGTLNLKNIELGACKLEMIVEAGFLTEDDVSGHELTTLGEEFESPHPVRISRRVNLSENVSVLYCVR